jgi:DNA-binding NtrC family response regulator
MFSTTQDLLQLVKQGVFLDELYYRIAENLIEIPSFNNNKEGLRNIIKSGFKFYQIKYRKEDIVLSDSAIKLLTTYNWNDNINELEKILEQIVIRNSGNVTSEDIEHMGLLKTEVEAIVSISDMEKEKIKDLLLEGYNKTQISQMLGFSRATLYRKMTEYGI